MAYLFFMPIIIFVNQNPLPATTKAEEEIGREPENIKDLRKCKCRMAIRDIYM